MYKLNSYSWSLILFFIAANFSMEYYSGGIPLEGFFMVLPLIFGAVLWSEQTASLKNTKDLDQNKNEAFIWDLFTITFSFILGGLISLLFEYNNTDARGWWPLIIFFISFCGLVFSSIYSLLSLLLPYHKRYTMVFACLIITILSLSKFFPRYLSLGFLGEHDFFLIMEILLISVHLLICLGFKMVVYYQKSSSH